MLSARRTKSNLVVRKVWTLFYKRKSYNLYEEFESYGDLKRAIREYGLKKGQIEKISKTTWNKNSYDHLWQARDYVVIFEAKNWSNNK